MIRKGFMTSSNKKSVNAGTVKSIRRKLLDWYGQNRRPLPWRTTPSAYGTVVSEFMLQQTQVTTVIPYFHRFMKIFPGFNVLAKASEQEVLNAWSGLGYYRRARYLKQTAERIVQDYHGKLPTDPDDLRSLPGFGEYTTGAVGSIALGLPLPLVDGNVRRVIGRLFTLKGDLSTGPGKKKLWGLCHELLDPDHPGDFNQALMELGALTCLPGLPACMNCPLKSSCRAHGTGQPGSWPEPLKRPATRTVHEVALAVIRNRKLLVLQRPDNMAFAGLWELPRMDDRELAGMKGPSPWMVLCEIVNIPWKRRVPLKLGTSQSTFTHHQINTTLFSLRLKPGERIKRSYHVRHQWLKSGELIGLPSGNAQKKLFELIRRSGLIR
jgi:A/G-specific adenine glycosylase